MTPVDLFEYVVAAGFGLLTVFVMFCVLQGIAEVIVNRGAVEQKRQPDAQE